MAEKAIEEQMEKRQKALREKKYAPRKKVKSPPQDGTDALASDVLSHAVPIERPKADEDQSSKDAEKINLMEKTDEEGTSIELVDRSQ